MKQFMNSFVCGMLIVSVISWWIAQGDAPVLSTDRLLCVLILMGYAIYVRLGGR